METLRRPAFHRATRFVAVGRITLQPGQYIEAGEELPPMRRASLLRLFRARMIGPLGDGWTNLLFKRRLRRLEEDKEAKRLYKGGEEEIVRIQKAMKGEVKLGVVGALVAAAAPQTLTKLAGQEDSPQGFAGAAPGAQDAPAGATKSQTTAGAETSAQEPSAAPSASGGATEPQGGQPPVTTGQGSFGEMRDPPSFEPPPRRSGGGKGPGRRS